MARLDRLASVRLVAQIGAAIGREFPYALLRAVSRLPEDELQAALARLVASELVFQRGMPPDAVYSFKHALVQDTAYGSLLRSARQQLHAQIAEALETHSPELMDNQPEVFAQHYAEAGLIEKSVACWGKAGQQLRRPLGDGGGGRTISKGAGPAGAVARRPRTSATASSNFGVPWARCCMPSKARRRRKRDRPMPAHESCGSGWVVPRSSLEFPMASRAITCTEANWIWHCAWTRICCV